MTRSIALVMSLMFAVTAGAFNGDEHAEASNAALRLVVARDTTPHAFKEEARILLESRGEQFGDLTRIADWYQDPERFAKAILSLSGDGRGGCCSTSHTAEGEACDDDLWREIRRRERPLQKLRHLAAVKRNDRHFQLGAVRAYSELHATAIAVRSCPKAALWFEALALHFLQDFWAPGHVVAPRERYDDTVAAALHDTLNREGAPVRLDGDGTTAVLELLEQFIAVSGPGASSLTRVRDLMLSDDRSTLFFGDGLLGGETQYDFVVTVSALSVAEVVDDSSRVARVALRLCFQPRSAKADASVIPRPVDGTFEGPFASLMLGVANPDNAGCDCHSGAFAWYDFSNTAAVQERNYKPIVPTVAVFQGGKGQRRVDAGLVVVSYDPSGTLRRRVAGEDCPSRYFNEILGARGSVHVTLVKEKDYHGVGTHVQIGHPWRWMSAFGYVGGRRYGTPGVTEYRPYGGVKLVGGLEIVNIVVGLERTHRLTSPRDFEPQYEAYAGFEVSLAPQWLRYITSRRKAPTHDPS